MCQEVKFHTQERAQKRKEYYESIERDQTESKSTANSQNKGKTPKRHNSCEYLQMEDLGCLRQPSDTVSKDSESPL